MAEYKLLKPIRVIDQDIIVLTFREPTGQDMIGMPDMESDKLGFGIALANRLASNVPADTILTKCIPLDAMRAGEVAMSLMIPTTPASSSTDISSAPAGGTTPASSG